MGFWNLLKFSTRMFKARTSRTLLTILGMGVGIGAILFLVALGFGIQKTLLETITTTDSLLALDVYPSESAKDITIEQIERISAVSGVELVSPVYETAAQIGYAGLMSDAKIVAADGSFLKLDGLKIIKGDSLSDDKIYDIVITSSLAKIFEKSPDEMIGETLKVFFQGGSRTGSGEADFRVAGWVDKKEVTVYLNQKFFAAFAPLSSYSRLKIKCSSTGVMADVRNQITGQGFVVSALTDIIRQVEKTFNIVRIILGLFGTIALMVSAIGMFNTMVVALMERTEEIGVMKSIGASDYDILWMFVFESTIMGFLGGIIGIVLGILGGQIVNSIFNFLAGRMGGYAISLFYYPVWFLLFILSVAVLVGFFTGLIPARKASATDPLEALRYK